MDHKNIQKDLKRTNRQNGCLTALCIILAVVLIAAVCAAVLFFRTGRSGGETQSGQAGEETEPAEQEETVQTDPETEEDGGVQEILDNMTLEEKVCQLFMITPEALTGAEVVVQAQETTRSALQQYPVGGLIYFSQNLTDPEQTKAMLSNTMEYAMERSGIPILLSVDEEGGEVARVGSNPAFGVPQIGNMCDVGASGDTGTAYETGRQIGAYLKELGFNMDAAPDADVYTNPENEVVKYRSFGSDPELVAAMATAELQGLEEEGILGLYKHYPGHGGTSADSHEGYAYVEETLEELMNGAFVPFRDGIENGIRVIMVSHIACPNVTGDNIPATLSEQMITEILRQQLGFDGVVITDALNMGAITGQYTSDQAAVAALQAGADILLMPEDFQTAYQGVLQAVSDGTLTKERIDESVRRILELKTDLQEADG